ncbi:hypothetical protein CHS0354_025744 [Potamilus streckersoni]|uniref:Uncharacterized protein n=1 Tax=Potamilus streckersoni TaxID=2493646 RepID=A0AAE0RUE2_9BIVA|nr:hypothetical protein CHS0354_025744 [Potamilus streckersoni]
MQFLVRGRLPAHCFVSISHEKYLIYKNLLYLRKIQDQFIKLRNCLPSNTTTLSFFDKRVKENERTILKAVIVNLLRCQHRLLNNQQTSYHCLFLSLQLIQLLIPDSAVYFEQAKENNTCKVHVMSKIKILHRI